MKNQASQDNFTFFIPFDIEKAKDEEGNEVMKIGGIASTDSRDLDGEYLNPTGFNLKPFLDKGYITYAHASSKDPMMHVGEPTSAKINDKNQLEIEGILYQNHPIAKGIYDMQNILTKNKSNRKFGYSIEGKATQRNAFDKTKVEKADIYNITITPLPKNADAYLSILKGTICEEPIKYEIETDENGSQFLCKAIDLETGDEATLNTDFTIDIKKDLSAGSTTGTETFNADDQSGAPLKKESLEGSTKPNTDKTKKKLKKIKNLSSSESDTYEDDDEEKENSLTKGEVFEYIFTNFTTDLEQSKKLYSYFQKISQMTGKENITNEDIQKAVAILDLVKGSTDEATQLNKMCAKFKEKGIDRDTVTEILKDQPIFTEAGIEKAVSENFADVSDGIEKGFKPFVNKDEKKDEKENAGGEEKDEKKDEKKDNVVAKKGDKEEDKTKKKDKKDDDDDDEDEDDKEVLEKAVFHAKKMKDAGQENDIIEKSLAKKYSANVIEKAMKFDEPKVEDDLAKGIADLKLQLKTLEDKLAKGEEVKEDKIEKAVVIETKESNNDELVKGIKDSVSEMIKGLTSEFTEQLESLREELADKVNELGEKPNTRKAILTKGYLDKGQELEKGQEDGKKHLSLKRNKREIINLIASRVDDSQLEKGIKGKDSLYMDVAASIEGGGLRAIPDVIIRDFAKENIVLTNN